MMLTDTCRLVCRGKTRQHLQTLKQERHQQRASAEQSVGDRMTPADLLKLGSFLVAISHVMDKIMLIARVIIDDSYEERESRISALTAIDSSRRNLSHEHFE